MSKEQYESKFDEGLQVFVPGPLGSVNFLREAGNVRAWDTERYLRINGDVRGYEQTALHHYLRFGWLESLNQG